MTDQPDDWLAAERERVHGPVTDEEIHAGYDALLDAWVAAREAAEARCLHEQTS